MNNILPIQAGTSILLMSENPDWFFKASYMAWTLFDTRYTNIFEVYKQRKHVVSLPSAGHGFSYSLLNAKSHILL
jgi:hypothetical protein